MTKVFRTEKFVIKSAPRVKGHNWALKTATIAVFILTYLFYCFVLARVITEYNIYSEKVLDFLPRNIGELIESAVMNFIIALIELILALVFIAKRLYIGVFFVQLCDTNIFFCLKHSNMSIDVDFNVWLVIWLVLFVIKFALCIHAYMKCKRLSAMITNSYLKFTDDGISGVPSKSPVNKKETIEVEYKDITNVFLSVISLEKEEYGNLYIETRKGTFAFAIEENDVAYAYLKKVIGLTANGTDDFVPSFDVLKGADNNGQWICANCGKPNQAYVGTCGCGTRKP